MFIPIFGANTITNLNISDINISSRFFKNVVVVVVVVVSGVYQKTLKTQFFFFSLLVFQNGDKLTLNLEDMPQGRIFNSLNNKFYCWKWHKCTDIVNMLEIDKYKLSWTSFFCIIVCVSSNNGQHTYMPILINWIIHYKCLKTVWQRMIILVYNVIVIITVKKLWKRIA